MATILVVEDEVKLRDVLRSYLERAGFAVLGTGSGAEAMGLAQTATPDLMVLDLRLPDIAGEEVAREIRTFSGLPILMLTAKTAEEDRIRGLEVGADDYLTKPFSRVELLARLQAISRRQVSRSDPVTTFDDGTLHVDFAHQEVTIDGNPIVLTPTEYRLLATLARHQGQVLSSDQLIELAWDDPSGLAPSRVKYAVLRLRRKLGWDEGDDTPIETVRGFGYRYRSKAR